MSIEAYLEKLLVDRGMLHSQAHEVLMLVKSDLANESMKGRWGEELTAYPEVIRNLAWAQTKRMALKWIDENAQCAWFRPLFVD